MDGQVGRFLEAEQLLLTQFLLNAGMSLLGFVYFKFLKLRQKLIAELLDHDLG